MKKLFTIIVIVIMCIALFPYSSSAVDGSVKNVSVTDPSKSILIKTIQNLFDKKSLSLKHYVNWDNGELVGSVSYATSDYIPVIPGHKYVFNNTVRGLAYYNNKKEYITGKENPINVITIPNNCYCLRFAFGIDLVDTIQFEEGTVSTPYKPFGYKGNSIEKKDEFLVFLPSEICVAVGRTIELYNSQVSWCGYIDKYHFKWTCKIGKAMKRKFSVTGTDKVVGEYPLTLAVYDNNMEFVNSASTIVKIVPNTVKLAKSILPIGDSLTNGKPWLGELRKLSGDKITFVGSRGSASLMHEGRSGFSAANYLTKSLYAYEKEGVQPFWDGERFNWSYYKKQNGINPDAVQIFLGTNGMELDPTRNAGNIKQIVDYIRQDDSKIPIFIVFTLFRGNQDGMGAEISSDGYEIVPGLMKLEEDRKVFNLMTKLNGLLGEYNNLHFIPISSCHDSEYNFGTSETPVNPRASQVEYLPVEATHPQLQGYYQMADIMFGVYAKYLNE